MCSILNNRACQVGFLLFVFSMPVIGDVPGIGFRLEALSDDFEDTSWTFNHAHNISSNGMWYGSYRGAPDIVERTASPAGGSPDQAASLRVREYSNQGDLVTKGYSTLYGRSLIRSDMPSFIARIYLPPYATMQQPYSVLGFRMEARSNQLIGGQNPVGYYYPSIWLQYYNYGGQYPNNFGVVVRMGDGQASDVYIKNMGSNYLGGWVTVGIGFDANGVGHYYFREGIGSFTLEDKIYDTTMFPSGSNAKMDTIEYHFFSVGGTDNNILSADYRVEDISVFLASALLPPDINEDGVVDLYDLAIITKHWLDMDCEDSQWCQGADLNLDGVVNIYDLMILIDAWLDE